MHVLHNLKEKKCFAHFYGQWNILKGEHSELKIFASLKGCHKNVIKIITSWMLCPFLVLAEIQVLTKYF